MRSGGEEQPVEENNTGIEIEGAISQTRKFSVEPSITIDISTHKGNDNGGGII